MKRSQLSSSPAPAYASPPVSPTITQVSSRSPTPSPPDLHDLPRRPAASSPTPARPRSPRQQQVPQKMVSRQGEATDKNEDAEVAPQRPAISASVSAPAGRLPRLLPYDASQYTEATLPPSALTHSATSLSELALLIRLQRYQETRRSQSRVKLHRWLVSAALSARLLHCGELSYRTLIENFRNDDRTNFTRLYNAIHDIRASCDATRRYAMLEPELDGEKHKLARVIESANSFSTFVHEIPQKIRNELLMFIAEIRTNPDFLASRLVNLTKEELKALTSFRPPLDPRDTVMAAGKGIPPKKQQPSAPVPNPVERLLSFQRHDPLSALLFTIFANSSGPDSSEDLRRTEAWATAFARLITDGKAGGEPIMRSVLDAYAAMRDWPAKNNLELFLMDVLQEGQPLIDRWEGNASKPAAMTGQVKDKELEYATEEFFDRCVKKLFEVIDDEPCAGGIPEGVLEISQAIFKKLSGPTNKKFRRSAEVVIIHRWFFTCYLRNALIWPESHGIMLGYHIPWRTRDSILKEIAFRAQSQARGMELELAFRAQQRHHTTDLKAPQPPQVLPEVKAHVESILARFRNRTSIHRPVLLPAKAITSPRETIEVQPFLVVCPADIVTLVKSLFPERRPLSSYFEKDSPCRGLASAASSISGMSIPFRNCATSTPGDGSSLLSVSASSMTSDTTSREPLLGHPDKEEKQEVPRLAVLDDEPVAIRISPTEEYGRRLRNACEEMTRILGSDATARPCHPCAERWAVLYVTEDGKGLRTRMRKDTEDDDDSEEDSPDSDSEYDGPPQRMDLEKEYHYLKENIFKLLHEYEVPKNIGPDSESKNFSNRTGRIHGKPRIGRKPDIAPLPEDPNAKPLPLTQSNIATLVANQRNAATIRHRSPQQHPRSCSTGHLDEHGKERTSDLTVMLEAALQQCSTRDQWVEAERWHRTLDQLRRLSSASLTRNGFAALLNYFARGPRDSIAKSFNAIEEFEAWFAWLKQSLERYDANVDDMMLSFKNLRDKMWYKSAVVTSAVYEEAKNVALALKLMRQGPKEGAPAQTQQPRSFILKREAQIVNVMAANPNVTGPNKLADEQAEMTQRWLLQYGVENFCKGEERIHRFCLEVDKCVNKLVGDSVLDGPVLWSSELFSRDKDILDSGRQKGDLFLTGVGTLSIARDEEYETAARPMSRSLDFARTSDNSLRSVTTQASYQSFDSGKWSNTNTCLNLMDAQDYFGVQSPALTIDSSVTFWSPFQTQILPQSPAGANSIRPNTSPSSRSTLMIKNTAAVNEDKRKFLLDLKQTLTGLLLSDLTSIAFSNGSETDAWFANDLGEECAARKEKEELWRKQRLARKKSMKNLRIAEKQHRTNALDAAGRTERVGPAPPVAALHQAESAAHHSGPEHSSGSDGTTRSTGLAVAKKAGLLDFPYNVAFRRLLQKFATHPSPFAKLHALYELELLIIASLSSRSGRYGRSGTLPTVPQSPTLGSEPELASREAAVPMQQAQNLDQAIANVTERRLHSMNVPEFSGRDSPLRRSGAVSPTVGPPSTDMIVDVLQSLFREAEIRPKTLFRDLQYIAAFVPASMLDKTARGKAFWDAGLAALGLKQDFVRYLVEIADEIVAENTEKRSAATARTAVAQQQANSQQPQTGESSASGATATPTPESLVAKWSMADAARMLTITAKEGDAVAERELAIFYLTHPDLVQRTLSPLSKPRDIFKGELLHRGERREASGAAGLRREDGRSDPVTMCVAQHWMECSRRGGDELATKYLRARDDMERIP